MRLEPPSARPRAMTCVDFATAALWVDLAMADDANRLSSCQAEVGFITP